MLNRGVSVKLSMDPFPRSKLRVKYYRDLKILHANSNVDESEGNLNERLSFQEERLPRGGLGVSVSCVLIHEGNTI